MELNREEIIQGLRDNDSPYKSDQDNIIAAIALIKELTEENERLRAQNETLETNNKDFKYRIYVLSRDNEEWEQENKDLEFDNDELRERITKVKADTVRKLQERLKGRMKRVLLGECAVLAVTEADIKQILNESLEDK